MVRVEAHVEHAHCHSRAAIGLLQAVAAVDCGDVVEGVGEALSGRRRCKSKDSGRGRYAEKQFIHFEWSGMKDIRNRLKKAENLTM